MQARTWQCGRAVCNCAIVAREGNDIISIDICHGSYGHTFPKMTILNKGSFSQGTVIQKDRAGNKWVVRIFIVLFMSTKNGHRGPVCGFLVSWLQIIIEPFALFHHNVMIICVSLSCFTDRAEDLFAGQTGTPRRSNVDSTLIQRLDVESTLNQRCFNAVWLQGHNLFAIWN